MSADVSPNLKEKAPCGCGCELFGTLGRPDRNGRRHVRGCGCNVCRGRRNRKQGLAKQTKAARQLGLVTGKFAPSNEESYSGYFANEMKSGKQCGPLANWWLRVEKQVEANRADHGDRHRPVRAVAMPAGWGDGLVVVRLSTWRDHIGPALEEFYGSDT